MKKIKPIIKSQTRVKSMFAFMHEDEKNEDFEKDAIIKEQTNEPIILQRTRGDVVLDNKKKEIKKVDNVDTIKTKSSKIIEVQSQTYGDKFEKKEKLTFKQWWQHLGKNISNGWRKFISKKGAIRFLIILSIMVIVSLGLIIHALTNRTSINDLFKSEISAFVLNEGDNSGVGANKKLSLKHLTTNKATKNNTMGYQYIELYGKDLNKFKSMDKLMFNIKTIFSDVTVKITLLIYYDNASTPVFESTPKSVNLAKNKEHFVSLNINQSIEFDDDTKFVIKFDSLRTSDLGNSIETPYDVDLSVYSFNYLK